MLKKNKTKKGNDELELATSQDHELVGIGKCGRDEDRQN